MIARLRGQLDSIGDDHVVLDVHGVGYLVYCPIRVLAGLPPVGSALDLHIETVVREDSITLFGFTDPLERRWFRLLQTVQGVGARVALGVIGILSGSELASAVARQDKAALTRASGVGARLAGRIVAELNDRLGDLPAIPAPAGTVLRGGAEGDAVSALTNLGYGRSDAQAAVARAQKEAGPEPAVDALIRIALRLLGPA
ncbi:MAG: Holliday junction branch migration protein RuvA [Geminicoccaceae bacterium]|nr:Holliday junction branch migration protein RuvA [Geminicoccaceae bacterium]